MCWIGSPTRWLDHSLPKGVVIQGVTRRTNYFDVAISQMTATSRNRNPPTNITPFAIDPIFANRFKFLKRVGLRIFRVLTAIRMSVEMPIRTITEMKTARKIMSPRSFGPCSLLRHGMLTRRHCKACSNYLTMILTSESPLQFQPSTDCVKSLMRDY
jgi:hypothetical protein